LPDTPSLPHAPTGEPASDAPATGVATVGVLAGLRHDQAVISWIHSYGSLPLEASLHLTDALIEWSPVLLDELVPAEPPAGLDCDLAQVIEAVRLRLVDAVAVVPDVRTKFVLARVGRELALALRSLTDPQIPAYRQVEVHQLPRPVNP